MSLPQTVAEVLSKHVVLEVESIDRMYLNVYVPQLQAVEGTLKFIRIHRGHKVASTRMVEPITREFVDSIERFAKDKQVPLITFEKGRRDSAKTTSPNSNTKISTNPKAWYSSARPRKNAPSIAPRNVAILGRSALMPGS